MSRSSSVSKAAGAAASSSIHEDSSTEGAGFRLRPRSPHMTFYRPEIPLDAFEQQQDEAEGAPGPAGGASQPSTRASTPSTSHSSDVLPPPQATPATATPQSASSSSSVLKGHNRSRAGTGNRLQAREDRPFFASSSRWNLSRDATPVKERTNNHINNNKNNSNQQSHCADDDDDDFAEDLDDRFDSRSPSQQSSHKGGSSSSDGRQRRRRSTGLLAASSTLWQSDLRVWARKADAHHHVPGASEASQDKKAASASSSGLAKKRLLAKRDSAQLLNNLGASASSAFTLPAINTALPGDAAPAIHNSSLANSFAYGSSGPRSSSWAWRKASATLSSSGLLVITTTDDRIPIHSIPTTLLSRTDFRLVDPSLFGQQYTIAIRVTATRPAKLDTPLRSPSTPAASFNTSSSSGITKSNSIHSPSIPFLSSFGRSNSSSDTSTSTQHPSLSSSADSYETSDFVYLCLGSKASQHALYVLLKSFGQSNAHMPSTLAPYESSEELRVSLQPQSSAAAQSPELSTSAPMARNFTSPPSRTTQKHKCRTWRSVDLTIVEGRNVGNLGARGKSSSSFSSDDQTASFPFSPTMSSSASGGVGTSSKDFGTSSSGSVSGKAKADEPSHGTIAASGKFFVEIAVDNAVLARTAARKGSHAPFWRETFSFQDLPPYENCLQLRAYVLVMRKGVKQVGCLGTVDIPVQTFKRSETVETWFPIVTTDQHEEQLAGELLLQIKVTEAAVLSAFQYQPLDDILSKTEDHNILYDVATNIGDMEVGAELLLRICLEQNTLQTRLKQMIELEIDGDESTANILFRGNTLLTKMVEQYLRLIGTDFLVASLGDIVLALCRDEVELEIDPAKLKSHHKPLEENISELLRWATYLWNSLYQARHKCPNDLRIVFAHIQTIVDERYDATVPTRRFTCISAFVFLRFFVPALLNPRLFGLVSQHPSPACQRTLTLLAKSLQGLANLSPFRNKEAFMSVMNPFVEENSEAFVDYITNIATPVPGLVGPGRSDWCNMQQEKYQLAAHQRQSISDDLIRDSIPRLPFLNDFQKDLALLASISFRCAQHNRRRAIETEAPQPKFASGHFDSFIRLCKQLHRLSQVHGRPSHLNGALFIPQMVGSPPARSPSALSESFPHTAVPSSSARGGSSSQMDDLGRSESLSVGSGNRFSFKLPSPRRNRAQTVSNAENRNATLRRKVSADLSTVSAAFSDVALNECAETVDADSVRQAGIGIHFNQVVTTESVTLSSGGADTASLHSDSGSIPRSSNSLHERGGASSTESYKPSGRFTRMLSRNS